MSELRQLQKYVNDKGFLTLLGKVKQVRVVYLNYVCSLNNLVVKLEFVKL